MLTDTVTVNYSVDLRLVSDVVGAPVDELMALNPSLLRLLTPPDASFDLHLPAGTATLFAERIAAVPESRRNAWRYHRITADDTLASVAREYRVTEPELATANHLRASESLQGIEALVVPVAPAAVPSARMMYTVRRGDTLVTIADRFGVSLNQLRRWNKISGIRVAPGRRLHVAEPASVRSAAGSHRHRTSAESGADGHKTLPEKEFSANPSAPSSKKHGSVTSKSQHSRKPGTAGSTRKNRASGTSKSHPHRPVAHSNSSTRQQN